MDKTTYDALPAGAVLTTSSACPACGKRDVVELRVVLEAAKVGTFSLAGAGTKFPARKAARYTCTSCGATGLAEPKD